MASKIVLITGVSQGLGRVMTAGFIRESCTVWGCARNPSAIAQLQAQFPPPHDFVSLDVRDESGVIAWRDRLLQQSPPPDFAINNAALMNSLNPLWNVKKEEFDRLVDVNIKGVANIIRQFVPAMIERDRGIIVNFSSGWGRSTSPQVAPYCATKWAIEGLTRGLAQELPPTMAAIPLNPGIIHTDMLEICYGEDAANFTTLEDWGLKAVPFILQLRPQDNGQPLTVPS